MATVDQLVGLGTPAELAKRLGWTTVTLATTGSAQGATGGLIKGIGNKICNVTMTTGADSVTLPSEAEIGDEIVVNNVSANAGVLFPHSGGNVNGESSNASMAIAAQGSTNCVVRAKRLTATRWGVWSAVVS